MKKKLFQNRLFIKIFLWFWLSFWLVNAVFLFVSFATQTELSFVHSTSLLVKTEARAAAEIFERNGNQALSEYLQKTAKDNDIQGFLFDMKGAELNGKKVSEIVLKAFANAQTVDEIKYETSGLKVYGAVLIETAAGSRFVFVAETKRFANTPFLNVQPQTRFLRFSLTIIVSGIICFLLARYFTKPITKLSQSARQLAKGNLAVRSGSRFSRRNDEIASLSRDFDAMAEQIERLIKSQKQLLSDISHELRSPLARLGIALELARSAETEAERNEMFEVIERESANLNEQIGEILTLTKLEAGNAEIQTEKVDVSELIKQVAADTDFEAKMKNRQVKIVKNEPCSMSANASLLRSAIENVVRNAVKYTAENTSVEISLSCEKDSERQKICIIVRDYGAGLPDKDLERIFTPFYRAEKGRERDSGGTGLGLAIAANAVSFHKGKIYAKNASDGGLIVTFDFDFV